MTKTEWIVEDPEVSRGRINLKGLNLMLQAGQVDFWRSLGPHMRRLSSIESRFGVRIDIDKVAINYVSTLTLKENCSIETSATSGWTKIFFSQLIHNEKGELVATSEISYLVRDKESGEPRLPSELKAAIEATNQPKEASIPQEQVKAE